MLNQLFGHYLIEKGVITYEDYKKAMEAQSEAHVRLGTIAVLEGFLTEEEAEFIHRQQMQFDKRFGDIAVSKGYLTDEQVGQLLKKQGDAYLQFVQTVTEEGLMDMSQLNQHMDAYKKAAGYSDEEFEDLKSSDLDRVVPLFSKGVQGLLNDYVSLMVRNLNRFIDTEIRLENLYEATEIDVNKAACQSMFGEHEIFVSFVGSKEGLVHIGSQFAKEDFSEVDEDVLDSVCEFINTTNGLFASSLSVADVEVDMHPPMMAMDVKVIQSNKLYILPIFLSGKKVELVLSLDEKVVVE